MTFLFRDRLVLGSAPLGYVKGEELRGKVFNGPREHTCF